MLALVKWKEEYVMSISFALLKKVKNLIKYTAVCCRYLLIT